MSKILFFRRFYLLLRAKFAQLAVLSRSFYSYDLLSKSTLMVRFLLKELLIKRLLT